jgi:hypothetical protein
MLPNLVLGLIAAYLGVSRPLVDLDYLALGVLVPWLPWPLGGLLLMLAMIVDIVLTVAPTYQFDLAKVVETAQELFNLSPAFVLPIIVAIGLGTAAVVALMLRLRPPSPPRAAPSLTAALLTLLALGGDVLLSPNLLTGMDRAVTSINIAGSPGAFFAHQVLSEFGSTHAIVVTPAPDRASRPIVAGLDAGRLPSKIVLVVVESWGYYEDAAVREQIVAPLRALTGQRPDLSLALGTTTFLGSTVNGEMRELCGIRSTSIRLPDPQIPLQDCLPHRLAALGYRTTAIHGYRGSMFNRLNWYPLAGFEHTWFDRDLRDLLGHSSRCGSTFPGVCDGDIAGLIGRELETSAASKQFIYWMTLNAHLPIFATTDPRAAADCEASAVTRDDEQQCRLVRLHRLVMQALADMMASRHDTGLVIVGDHAPAFVSGERRHHLSSDHVPHAVLWPRDAAAAPTAPP